MSGTIILTVSYGKFLYLEEIRVLECHALGWFPWVCHKKALIWPRILVGLRRFLYYFGKKILHTVKTRVGNKHENSVTKSCWDKKVARFQNWNHTRIKRCRIYYSSSLFINFFSLLLINTWFDIGRFHVKFRFLKLQSNFILKSNYYWNLISWFYIDGKNQND